MAKLSNDKMKELAYLLEQRDLAKCRADFWEFCKYIDPAFFNDDKPHLKLIATKLQAVADGKLKKLAISLPPRAGKSYITSAWCAWALGRDTLKGLKPSIMRNSYGADLAEKFSKDIRDGLIAEPKFKKVFPGVVMSKNNTAVDGWSLHGNTQPSYFCAGIGGALTGKGCRTAAILDDPLKNFEEAMSETKIVNVWDWYTSTHMSRREKGCPTIHIATRWSKRDPIGRLTDPDSQTYTPDMEVIKISALDENGKSYCEAIISTEELLEIRRITDPIIWESEWMQNPIEEKGLMFPPADLKRFGGVLREPDGVIAYIDTADVGSDYLCTIIAYRYGDKTYIADVVFSQDGMEITLPQVLLKLMKHKCSTVTVESNNGGVNFARELRNKLREQSAKCSVLWHPTTKNKETRIIVQSAYIKEYFYFRNDFEPGSDYDKFFRQFTGYVKFGRNTHDDAADCCTGVAELVPYRSFNKPQTGKHYNFEFERKADEETSGNVGTITDSYLNFMGGN